MAVVEYSQAAVFVIENVPEVLRSQEFAEIKYRAELIGFKVISGILNAADYGVAQTRRRAFIVGWK